MASSTASANASNVMAAANPDKTISKYRNHQYPVELWWTLAAFIGLLTVIHWTTVVIRLTRIKKGPSSVRAGLHFVRAAAFRVQIPYGVGHSINVAEFLAACAYIVTIFTWQFINTTDLKGNRFTLRYWTNRAGHIAAAQFPLLIGLGMKNNFISLLTGVSYEKLNFMHRIVARVIVILLWVHAGGRIKQSGKKVILEDLEESWLRMGVTAAITLSLLAVLSLRPIRNRSYEVFLVAHFLGAIIVLAGAYVHTAEFHEQIFLYPSLGLYFFDRLLRVLRLCCQNGGYRRLLRVALRQTPNPVSAKVEVISPTLLRLRVSGVPHWVRWGTGQVMYLSAPRISRLGAWEAHPFSIANPDNAGELPQDGGALTPATDRTSMEKESSDQKEKALPSESSSPEPQLSSAFAPARSRSKEMVFLVRARKGFTHRLLDFGVGKEAEGQSAELPVYLDGPYGKPATVDGCEQVVLFAGGSGVSFTLPILLEILGSPSSNCEKLLFVWSIRDASEIAAIRDTLNDVLSRHDRLQRGIAVDIRIHLSNGKDSEGVSEKHPETLALECFPSIQISNGRPNVDGIVREAVAGAGGGNLSINVCGPTSMAEDVRSALRRETGTIGVWQGKTPLVKLHVETFGI